MKIKLKNKKKVSIVIVTFALLVTSFLVYNKVGKADAYANQISMKNVYITGIDTGNGQFDSDDGLNYSDTNSYTKIDGYTAGNDAKKNNRIVRSFDTLTYHFNYEIKGKNVANDYEERTVNIKVILSDEEAKYVTFDKNAKSGEKTHTFSFDGTDTYGEFYKDIVLYVLGAPNGIMIHPKFEIQESTNTDANEIITLGNVSDDTYYYDYDSEKNNKYSSTSTTTGFINYMPTVVSSVKGNLSASFISINDNFQKATYKDQIGRYMTAVLKLSLIGNETKGLKGLSMPKDNSLSIPLEISSSGGTLSTEGSWTRRYGNENVGDISPIVVSSPYSTENVDLAKRTRFPGEVNLKSIDANKYSLDISNFYVTFQSATSNADDSPISNVNNIGSYAITFFSGRTKEDANNDIRVNFFILPQTYSDTNGDFSLTTTERPYTISNKYYENVDYSLIGEFYDKSGSNKISNKATNSDGAVSKGTELTYRTTFNYKKTMSSQGLKEVIKVDPNAYRIIPMDDKKDIKISVISDTDSKLSENDFEISYVSGNYNNSNYSAKEADSRIGAENLSAVQACDKDLSNLSVDEIQNLYGGPCIKANEGAENIYSKIADAKAKSNDNEIEDPITKVIVQTKEGVKLPDSVTVIIDVGVRVRNVSDLTQTYQATVVASSSDYDSELTYYAPRIIDGNENSITSKSNYRKSIYAGSTYSYIDEDSPWGDCLKLVNFTSRQNITVTNKNTDGTTKINYNVVDNETLNYNVKTFITDNNENVGADDVWYINYLKVYVYLPSDLEYIPDKSLGLPESSQITSGEFAGGTMLVYTLPYTKPNQKINDINFKAILKPNISGTGKEITVMSTVEAININGETDTSYFGYLSDRFSIYATGIQNVIVNQKIGKSGTTIEKNGEINYILNGYNNTGSSVKDYNIVDILPSTNDKNNSKFSGSYKVKVDLPSNLSTAKVYCSTQDYSKLTEEVFNNNNVFDECNITEDYVDATAIKITDIAVDTASYIGDIVVSLKTEGNNYSDKYVNSFIGGSRTYSTTKSNKITARVVSRNIGGRVFVDMDEDGIEEEGDKYLANVPFTLYKLDSDNNAKKIADTATDKNGKYVFKDLDVGRYKIEASYDASLYDLTLRYATEDYEHDSDAYKIEDGKVEIAYIRTIDDNDSTKNSIQDLKVTREIESVSDMNIGLINKKNFGFDMSKYITKIDLSYNNTLNTLNYNNESKVTLSVKNSLKATAKVYYGITITNNSSKAGYAKLIQEDIPNGMIFDQSDPYNSEWFESNGSLRSIAYENDLINPGESRYLKIALNMPRQEQATTFINTVTMLEILAYEPVKLAEDKNADSNSYEIGEALTYAGVNWHVISANPGNTEDEQILTLLADHETITNSKKHGNANTSYKWSTSEINNYINNSWIKEHSLNPSILYDQVVCNDASGTPLKSHGGEMQSTGQCITNDYVTTKVRLLTENEYNSLLQTNLSDLSWLRATNSNNYWLENASWIEQEHNSYGQITDATNYYDKARYVSENGISDSKIQESRKVRPVITISNKNIIPE